MPITITVDIDAAGVMAAMEVMPLAVAAEVEKAMIVSTYIAEAEIKALTPRKTGRLFSSWSASTRGVGANVVGIVGTSVSYAPYVEAGTGPHTIVAKPGSALYWPGARHPVKRVRHPGFVGRHMARLGLAIAKPAIVEEFRRSIKRAVEIALGK